MQVTGRWHKAKRARTEHRRSASRLVLQVEFDLTLDLAPFMSHKSSKGPEVRAVAKVHGSGA